MKKCIVLILITALSATAFAEAIDWSSMNEESIYAEINNALAELTKRDLAGDEENKTLFNEKGFTIVCKSVQIDKENWMYTPCLSLDVVAVNESDADMIVSINTLSVNGWEIDHTGYFEIGAGHKAKDMILGNLADADVTDLDEVKTIEISFIYEYPSGSFDYVNTEPITLVL